MQKDFAFQLPKYGRSGNLYHFLLLHLSSWKHLKNILFLLEQGNVDLGEDFIFNQLQTDFNLCFRFNLLVLRTAQRPFKVKIDSLLPSSFVLWVTKPMLENEEDWQLKRSILLAETSKLSFCKDIISQKASRLWRTEEYTHIIRVTHRNE